jgi:hypothetical protein
LPLLIQGDDSYTSLDNIITGLEHSDRIREIDLNFLNEHTTSKIEKLWTAMQVPFPELVVLELSMSSWHFLDGSVLPDSLLGRSAPRLRYFYLHGIPFPGLPKLLLSATHLVELYLFDTPHSGYISPEAMAACLSMLTSLDALQIEFVSPRSCPDLKSRRLFPPTRSVLPTLTHFYFKGLNEYLEEYVARIDAPQLYRLSTIFFNYIDFNTPELKQFISRTPTLGAYDEAHLIFASDRVRVRLRQCQPERSDQRMVEVQIMVNRELSTLAKICTLSLGPLLTMENLYIDASLSSPLVWEEEEIENTECLDLLLPFTAVKNLYLSYIFSARIALALQELRGGRTTEVLPALQNILLERFQPLEPVHEGIAQFISARQLTNHPVAISVWDEDRSCVVDD